MSQSIAPAPGDRIASEHPHWHGQGGAAFLTQLVEKGTLPPDRVLIPSADMADETLALARLRFRVTVVDPRETALRALRALAAEAKLPVDTYRREFLRGSPSLHGAIEYIVDRTYYHSLPPHERAGWSHRVARILPTGGRLVGLFLVGRDAVGPPYPVSLADLQRSLERLFHLDLLDPVGAAGPGRPNAYRALFRRR